MTFDFQMNLKNHVRINYKKKHFNDSRSNNKFNEIEKVVRKQMKTNVD